MQACPECGNHTLAVRLVDGAPLHECGLCGACFGGRRVVAALADADEAGRRAVPVAVWPLVRELERLPGLCVRGCGTGDSASGPLPFVELGLLSPPGVVQLENVVKSLRLGAGGLRLPWVVEVEFRQHLAFVLQPRPGAGPVAATAAEHARADVAVLATQIARDRRLSWWRHAGDGGAG